MYIRITILGVWNGKLFSTPHLTFQARVDFQWCMELEMESLLSIPYFQCGIPGECCISFHLYRTCPLYNVLLEVVCLVFCCCFPRNKLPMFVGSQSFISLPSFMFVSAVVSEIRELKKEKEKEKKNSEMDYFQFNTFPGHLIYPFLTRGTF